MPARTLHSTLCRNAGDCVPIRFAIRCITPFASSLGTKSNRIYILASPKQGPEQSNLRGLGFRVANRFKFRRSWQTSRSLELDFRTRRGWIWIDFVGFEKVPESGVFSCQFAVFRESGFKPVIRHKFIERLRGLVWKALLATRPRQAICRQQQRHRVGFSSEDP